MKDKESEFRGAGHLRFTLQGDKLAVGPWSFSVSTAPGVELKDSGLVNWLHLLAIVIEQGGVPDETVSESAASRGLAYEKFRLEGDAVECAPEPMSREEIADALESAARQALDPGIPTDVVAFNLIVSLCNDLFFSAMRSNHRAQRTLFSAAQNVVNRFTSAAMARAPGIIEQAEEWPWIPGIVSLGSEVDATMKDMCQRVRQGARYHGPPQTGGKGKKATLNTAQHHLVERLFRYMDSHRHNAALLDTEQRARRLPQLAPLVQRLAALPPLGVASVGEWIAASREVLLDATGGAPLTHPAFQRDGEFESLGNLDRRGEPKLWKALREAWQLRAKRASKFAPKPKQGKIPPI